MNKRDFNEFSEAWADAHEVLAAGRVLSQRAMVSAFSSLEDYDIEPVLAALRHHCKTSRYAPVPADIVDLLSAHNKRLSADEAWAMMPRSEDETVVWTEEMAAAYAVAFDLITEGDRIAARMAFKGAYERLCSEASIMQAPVVWKVCTGYDKTMIEPVLQKAVLAGRITQQIADKYLPAPKDAGVIAGLLTGKVTEMPNNAQHLKSKWRELSQAMKDGQKMLEDKKRQDILDREAERIELAKYNHQLLEKASLMLENYH